MKCPAGTYGARPGLGHSTDCSACPEGLISLQGSSTEDECLPAAKIMPETLEFKVSPDDKPVPRKVLLVNLLNSKMTWRFSFPHANSGDSWYTVAALENETDVPAIRHSPSKATFAGALSRFQFFDVIVFAVEDLSQLPLNTETERRCSVVVNFVNENGTNINFSLPLDLKVTHTAGRASASQSLLSAMVCSSSSNCTAISAAQPLTAQIPALTKMDWTLSTRDALGHPRDKSDEAKITVRCKDEAGEEHDGTDSAPYGACIIKQPSDEKNGNYTFALTPLRTGKLTLIVTIGDQPVSQANHMTFAVSKPVCPPHITVLSELEADIRNPCVCAIGTRRAEAGSSGSSQCELCPAGTFTLEQGAPDCQVCPKEAKCLGGAEVLNAAGFWMDLQCVANGVEQMSLSRKQLFDQDQCPFMKCPGGTTACLEPNRASLFAQELKSLYYRLPSMAASNKSVPLMKRSLACPPEKCPIENPWLSAASLNCYPDQAKPYYIYCPPSGSLGVFASETETLARSQVTSLQCNTGYDGRLCASCSKGYGLQVRPRASVALVAKQLTKLCAGRSLSSMPRSCEELDFHHPRRAVRRVSYRSPDVDHSQRRRSKFVFHLNCIPDDELSIELC